jgi:hypothetical protein
MDVVLYFISILAKLDIPDMTGKVALDYCQSEEIQAVVSRNTRRGLEDKNEITPEFDYGHFKWSKAAEDNFTSQNPLRAQKTPKKDTSEKEDGGARVGAPMTPSETESKDECEMDFFCSPLDNGTGTSRKPSDVHVELAPGDDETQQQVGDEESLPVPSGLPASSQIEKRMSGGGSKATADTYMAGIVPKSSSSAVTAGSPSPSTKANSSFYHMFRKDGILTKLADGRQSGRAVTAGSGTVTGTGTGNRKHRDA